MSENIESLSAAWQQNPEPYIPEPRSDVIVENVIGGSAYMWKTTNTDAWLTYDGEPIEVQQ